MCDPAQNLLCDPTAKAIVEEIIRPLIFFLFALALLYFIWGVVRFISGLSKGSQDGIKNGRKHLIWGILGLAVMISAFGIMNFIFNTVTNQGTIKGITGQDVTKPPVIDTGL